MQPCPSLPATESRKGGRLERHKFLACAGWRRTQTSSRRRLLLRLPLHSDQVLSLFGAEAGLAICHANRGCPSPVKRQRGGAMGDAASCHLALQGVGHSERRAEPLREPATAHRARRRWWPAAGRWLLASALLCGVSSSRQCSESWTLVSRSSGPASGGFALSLAGMCLRNGTDVHSVVFSCPQTGEGVAVEATTSEHDSNSNASTVAFVAPPWGFAACDTVITLQVSSQSGQSTPSQASLAQVSWGAV